MIDLSVVEIILVSGIGGLGVRAIVSQLKNFLKLNSQFANLALTFVVCAAATAAYLVPVGWNWGLFAVYTAFVFAASQGWYRASH